MKNQTSSIQKQEVYQNIREAFFELKRIAEKRLSLDSDYYDFFMGSTEDCKKVIEEVDKRIRQIDLVISSTEVSYEQ